MKNNGSKLRSAPTTTLAQLVATVGEMTHNDQLTALIVADMINSRLVKLEGDFSGKRVVVELPDAQSHAKNLAARKNSNNGKRRELVAA
jgi:hypothetical protein